MRIEKNKAELFLAKAEKTKKGIATETGLALSTVHQGLEGNRNVSPRTFGKIAKALGAEVEDIVSMEKK